MTTPRVTLDSLADAIERGEPFNAHEAATFLHSLRERVERGALVCARCNDYHDEASLCVVCAETQLQIEREQHARAPLSPADDRAALLAIIENLTERCARLLRANERFMGVTQD